jgi:Flp pilus assembly pilin Flp
MGTSEGEAGATAVEYALMTSLIAVVIALSVAAFGQAVLALFNSAVTFLTAA